MSLTALLVHDVTVVVPGAATSRYGDAIKDWATATRTSMKGWVARTATSEVHGDREAQVSEWKLYLPAGTVIDGGDRVEWQGTTFEVEGPPTHAWTPRGEHHLEVPLRVAAG